VYPSDKLNPGSTFFCFAMVVIHLFVYLTDRQYNKLFYNIKIIFNYIDITKSNLMARINIG
jgi:hypothetical protein